MQPGAQQIQCEGCGYDLAGLAEDGACPECGRPMRPSNCRGCGYSLAGLDVEGVCPECGRPVRDSLTRRRRGSPWQRAPGVGSWVMTTAGLLVSPRSFWDDVRVEEWKSWNLMNVNLMVTSSVPFLLAAFFGAFGMGALMWLVMFVTLFILNMMVTAAVHFGRSTGPGVAQAAVGHASGLWVVGAAAMVLIAAVGAWLVALAAMPGALVAVSVYSWIGAGRLRHVAAEGGERIGS